jgi:hypothetical protein
VLAGNPVPGAGNQIEIITSIISKDFLKRRILGRIERNVRDTKMEDFSLCIYHRHCVANLYITQMPEDRGIPSGAIKMSIDYGTAPFTWNWP